MLERLEANSDPGVRTECGQKTLASEVIRGLQEGEKQ